MAAAQASPPGGAPSNGSPGVGAPPTAQVVGSGGNTYYTSGQGTYGKKPIRMMQGGGYILSSGIACLHRGETVVPAGHGGHTFVINATGNDGRKLALEVRDELLRLARSNPDIFGGKA